MTQLVRDDELQLIADAWPSFSADFGIEWPQELVDALTADLGPEWLALTLAAIASRESRMGLLLDKTGRGDGGHGHGIMQIDDRSHAEFIRTGKWRDLDASLEYVMNNVIMVGYNYLSDYYEDYDKLWWATVAAYNCGPGNVKKSLTNPDACTTGKNYSHDVRNRALELSERLED